MDVEPGAMSVETILQIDTTGPCDLEAWFEDHGGHRHGAYYVYVERA